MITRDTDESTRPRIVMLSGWVRGGVDVGSLARIGREVSGGVVLAESLAVRVRHGLGLWCVVLGVRQVTISINRISIQLD